MLLLSLAFPDCSEVISVDVISAVEAVIIDHMRCDGFDGRVMTYWSEADFSDARLVHV